MQDKKRLIKLHNHLKEHLFRQTDDKTYLTDYLKEYHNLMDAFYDEFPYEVQQHNKTANAIGRMYHDCSSTISTCKNNNKYYDGIRSQYLEMCLMVFHKWLDTGEVPVYYQLWNLPEKHIVRFIHLKDDVIDGWYKFEKNNTNKDVLETIDYFKEEMKEKPEYQKYIDELQHIYDNFDELFKDKSQW